MFFMSSEKYWKLKALSTINKTHLKNWFREGDFATKTRRRPLGEDEFFRLCDRDRHIAHAQYARAA